MIEPTVYFARPWALLLLLGVALGLAAILLERRRIPRLRHPRAAFLSRNGPGLAAGLWWLPQTCVLAAIALVAVSLARPRARERVVERSSVDGIDIVVALDLSLSMRAADFQPRDRLHVAKEVLKEFVKARETDRVGLVVFAGDAFTRCPLTLDHELLVKLVDGLETGVLEDGTAVGNALATAVNRLRESEARSRAVVLITDGDSNAGQVAPLDAAALAAAVRIPVFPILVGKGGLVPYPVAKPFGVPIYENLPFPVNPELLQEIARTTGGAYWNAIDRASLEHGLEAVLDRMEKTRIFESGGTSRERELFPALLEPAFWLVAAALALGATRWRSFP